MPIYEFVCMECASSREVLADFETAKSFELLCVRCGGVMNAKQFYAVSLAHCSPGHPHPAPRPAKACGHGRHCRCAIKPTAPNPFQDRVDAALRDTPE